MSPVYATLGISDALGASLAVGNGTRNSVRASFSPVPLTASTGRSRKSLPVERGGIPSTWDRTRVHASRGHTRRATGRGGVRSSLLDEAAPGPRARSGAHAPPFSRRPLRGRGRLSEDMAHITSPTPAPCGAEAYANHPHQRKPTRRGRHNLLNYERTRSRGDLQSTERPTRRTPPRALPLAGPPRTGPPGAHPRPATSSTPPRRRPADPRITRRGRTYRGASTLSPRHGNGGS